MTIYTEIANIQTNLNDIEQQIAELEAQIAELQSQIDGAKGTKKGLEKQLQSLIFELIKAIEQASNYMSRITFGGEQATLGDEPIGGIE